MRTTHTMTVTFTVQSNAPEPGVDVDIEAIEIDGQVVDASAGAEKAIRNALDILEAI